MVNGTATATAHQFSPLTVTPPLYPKGGTTSCNPVTYSQTSWEAGAWENQCLGKPLKSSTSTSKHDGSFPRVKNMGN